MSVHSKDVKPVRTCTCGRLTTVTNTRDTHDGLRRTRTCAACVSTWITIEVPITDYLDLKVGKENTDGQREDL